ncbi:MAG TPA: chromate efflux transporter [Steroidobacteraceae bacterium]|nr:chromate efflux transporter [Steroidobacteraceae bacterium]
MEPGPSAILMHVPARGDAFLFWLKLGFISFGGPAGQIAIMHREIVERRRWLAEQPFMHALNFCMLLPGPEALQLAIYLGWRMHGVAGGIVAGLCFIVPAVLLLLGLSFAYAIHGEVPAVAALLFGLQATVVALVLHALIRVARRALSGWEHWLIAPAAFVLMAWKLAPFPLVLVVAALMGALARRGVAPPATRGPVVFPWRSLFVGVSMWAMPAAVLLSLTGPGSLYSQVYGFFTTAAFVTFGGAYAVLAYVGQQAVEAYGWLTQAETVAGLALAETTPGPLIIVLQFVGFMAGWNAPGAAGQAATATTTALLATWATFLPSFVFILVGAPYVERLTANPRLAAALAGITAAVVGVIANLAVVFAGAVIFPAGIEAPHWPALAIALVALIVLERTRIDVLWVIAGGAATGLLVGMA